MGILAELFKDKRCNEDFDQSILHTFRDYRISPQQLGLMAAQRASFSIHLLSGPTQTFFCEIARDDISYKEMEILVSKECESDALQIFCMQKCPTKIKLSSSETPLLVILGI